MRFNNLHQFGFDMSLPSFSEYIQQEENLISYQSILPYSEIRYVLTSSDKEQHLNFRFGRQITSRLCISFAINSDFSPGVFKNDQSINNYFWINAHYLTKNKRYGATLYFYRNKLEMQENGGIVNDEDYSLHSESDNLVINTNLTTATNFIKSTGTGLDHYFNLLPQTTQVKVKETQPSSPINDSLFVDSLLFEQDSIVDSINIQNRTKEKKFTLGRICHQFSYQRNQLFYNESSPTVAFYQPFDTLLNSTNSTDTTIVYSIKNTLKWNNLGYRKYNDDIPFYLYAGLLRLFQSEIV